MHSSHRANMRPIVSQKVSSSNPSPLIGPTYFQICPWMLIFLSDEPPGEALGRKMSQHQEGKQSS